MVTVLTYGHFSSIHPGHLRYLGYAKKQGEKVIIAVAGDERDNKGNPIYPYSQEERIESLRRFTTNEELISLANKDLAAAIKDLKPDFLVLGIEHKNTNDIRIHEAIDLQVCEGRKVLYHVTDQVNDAHDLLTKTEQERKEKKLKAIKEICEKRSIQKSDINELLENWKNANILVIGDTIVDEYSVCEALGLSAEAPVVVVKEIEEKKFVGGASIVASHISALGAKCSYISVTGDDEASEWIRSELNSLNINCSLIKDKRRPTTVKKRYVVDGQKLFRVSKLDEKDVDSEVERKVIEELEEKIKTHDGIVISDFVYGVITDKVKDTIESLATKKGIPIFADLQCSSQVGSITKYRGAELICPNEREAKVALQKKDINLEQLSLEVMKVTRSKNMIMKIGAEGFIVYQNQDDGRTVKQAYPALAVTPVDVTGAGDSLLAGMAIGLSLRQPIMKVAFIGTFIACTAVETMGNVPITIKKLESKITEFFD
ncbi:PfkB family carbohydrate kinase [Synechococcus sp. A15-28]|uniref:PfkB family carbohydrate kinase n=1 Tax=Synechococcus sp. A15-28 TaxID=1050638 RepID=UPI0016494046|nr:PfkB family carbohydrate kinase [Synechococcus sp. A15-28]QNI41220.1 cytidyltransferase-like domain protein [Synechococcus sp. A15-28]